MLKTKLFKVSSQKKTQKTKSFLVSETIEHKSYNFVNLVGYLILILISLDYLNILIPPQLFNPNWELETIGRILETIWILLLGFMLIFFRTKSRSIKSKEITILSWLSRITLIIAICCFIAIPLIISDALRISQTMKTEFNTQVVTKNNQIEKVITQVNQASNQEIQGLLKNNQIPNTPNSIQDAKQQLNNIIRQQQQTNEVQLKKSVKKKQLKLFKTTFKWILSSIISGIVFIFVWQYTDWARNMKNNLKSATQRN